MEASAASGAGGDKYEALCDVSEKVSCTKVFNTSFAKGFGVLDKIVGEWTCAETLFYILVPCISFENQRETAHFIFSKTNSSR